MADEPKEARALATIKDSPLVCEDDGSVSNLLDTAKFEQMQRIAGLMKVSSLMPDHLTKGNAQQCMANCFLVTNQAIRWGLDPFAVAPCTYVVRGKLGFEGKLIAAIVNTRSGLRGRLSYTFEGAENTDARTITVSGTFLDEDEPRTITLSVGKAKTDNKMWRDDPDQKLVYSGATKWARRHAPEVILGVLSDDDLNRIDESEKLGRRVERVSILPRVADDTPEPEVTEPTLADEEAEFDAAAAADEAKNQK